MAQFDANTLPELAKLLAVAPHEIQGVIQDRRRYYRNTRLTKPGGGFRLLRVPDGPLKFLQDKIRRHLLDKVGALDCVHGGVRGRSPATNAKLHTGKPVVFTLDVKDFFPSVGPATIRRVFSVLGFGAQALEALVDATTWDNQLPQGAPTSVALANLAMYRVDVRILRLARLHGFAYTRYVDDLAISGGWRLLDFRRLVQRIVQEEGFRINPAKVKTMPAHTRQVVTGLIVNEKLNLPREQRDEMRRRAVHLDRLGIDPATVRGQLAWFSSINPQKAIRLRGRVRL
ncbi:MAG TPA: reverse transcriptase family protein [Candidatus Limnocylindrales bacterium]|nr:reverse transcriptase family protein [Candidatus Limnocylindrales bacterium]